MGSGGAVLDEVRVMPVTGGDAGIDEVYRMFREHGVEVHDHRRLAHHKRRGADTVRARAIFDALELARAS